ncbi:MAG: MarR family transcriptional regulator [Chlorobi bacterium]|nr:MarR family transcriptional regulator [Chlorobiota bacterium]
MRKKSKLIVECDINYKSETTIKYRIDILTNVKPRAFVLFTALLELGNTDEFSMTELVKEKLGMSKEAYSAAKKELIEKGYLKVEFDGERHIFIVNNNLYQNFTEDGTEYNKTE